MKASDQQAIPWNIDKSWDADSLMEVFIIVASFVVIVVQ